MKGILFSPENIKAIVEGRKTQTRRLVGLRDINWLDFLWFFIEVLANSQFLFGSNNGSKQIVKPRYRVGEVVYIKEAWGLSINDHGHSCLCYKLTNDDDMALDKPQMMRLWNNLTKQWVLEPTDTPSWYPNEWHSPLFMPAWAARNFIKIADVQPQRLQEITEEDANAEGNPFPDMGGKGSLPPIWWFKKLWDSINKKIGTRWQDNPWVWVYHFELAKEG